MSEAPLAAGPGGALPVPAAIASALPDIALAVTCLAAWVAPAHLSPELPGWILLTMLLEFVVIHSSAFMGQLLFAGGGAGRRALGMLGLGLFYTLFVGAFALAFHTAWPLVSFWLLMLNRMSSVLLYPAPNRDQRAFLGTTWSAHVVCYIAGVLLTLVLPLPSLGLTPQFVASMHLPGRGIWVTQPWRVIAFGAFYFAVIAWCEWTNYRTFTRRGDSPPPA